MTKEQSKQIALHFIEIVNALADTSSEIIIWNFIANISGDYFIEILAGKHMILFINNSYSIKDSLLRNDYKKFDTLEELIDEVNLRNGVQLEAKDK